MKKFIIHIIVFFAIVMAIDFVFGKTCDYMTTHAKGGETKQLVDLCKKDHYDMLVMGSSKAHHNYIPQVFTDSLGLTCYNAGYDGNGIILAYGILSMIEEDRLPKLIVYDVKPQFDIYKYKGDGDYTRYFQKMKIFYGEEVVNSIIRRISRLELIKLWSGLVRYNGELINTIFGFCRRPIMDDSYGYKPAFGQLEEDTMQEKDYTNHLDLIKLVFFRDFIRLVKEKNITLVVVFSPEYKTPFSDDFQPIRDLCDSESILVVDCFDDPSFQKMELFKDHCHLNEQGAEEFTSRIVEILGNGTDPCR